MQPESTTRGSQRIRTAKAFAQKYAIIGVLILVVLFAQFLYSGFLAPTNLENMVSQGAEAGIIAGGMTFVILTGGFDLSVGSTYALSAVVFAKVSLTYPLGAAICAALIVGLLVGLFNAILVTVFKVNPFIATLGSGSIIVGLAVLYSEAQPILSSVPGFDYLGTGRILGIPISIIILIIVFAVGSVVLHLTVFGKNIYAIGGSEEASVLAGVRVNLTRGASYLITGLLASLAGVLIASTLSAGQSNIGGDMALSTIAMVVIGGTVLGGGEGAMWRTGVGFFILAVVQTLFNSLALDSSYINIAQGAILVIAVALEQASRMKLRLFGRRATA